MTTAKKTPKPRGGAKTAAKPAHLFVEVDHHQLAFEDSKQRGQPFAFATLADGVEAQRYGVVLHLRRAAGSIPVLVEVLDGPPTAEALDSFHLVSEASFEAPSGKLVLSSTAGGPEPTFAVPRGSLRLQARQADLDTSTYDGSDGADHYRVLLWPAPLAKTKVLRSRAVDDDVLFPAERPLARLEADLSAEDPTARCLAVVEGLRHVAEGHTDAATLLRRAARDEATTVRATLAGALGLAGEKGRALALELLPPLAKDRAREVRRRVPEALARLGGPAAAKELLALMAGPDAEVADAAGGVSWQVALAAADVLPLLRDKRAHVRLAGLRVTKGHERLRKESDEPFRQAVRALVKDVNLEVRALAATLVEEIGDSPEALFLRLKAKRSDERESAAKALGKLRDPAAFEPLAAALAKDKDSGVQRAAAEALGLLGDRRAVPLLAAHLEDETYNLNWYCARALAKLGGPEATRLLWRYASLPGADAGIPFTLLQPSAAPKALAAAAKAKFPELREAVFLFDEPEALVAVLDAVKEPPYPKGLDAAADRVSEALAEHLRSQGLRPDNCRYFPYHRPEQIREVCAKAGFPIPDRPQPSLGGVGREAAQALVDMIAARADAAAGETLGADRASPDVDEAVLDVPALLRSQAPDLCAHGLLFLERSRDVGQVAPLLGSPHASVVVAALGTLKAVLEAHRDLRGPVAKAVQDAAGLAKHPSKEVQRTLGFLRKAIDRTTKR